MHSWGAYKSPASNAGILAMIEEVQKVQRGTGNKPIVVHCRYIHQLAARMHAYMMHTYIYHITLLYRLPQIQYGENNTRHRQGKADTSAKPSAKTMSKHNFFFHTAQAWCLFNVLN